MSKCTEIRDICGDYAFDVEYSENNKFTMFFNSYRNAKTVKRCIEVDDSVPNVATAVDFVEVVRCKECVFYKANSCFNRQWDFESSVEIPLVRDNDFCSYGERREKMENLNAEAVKKALECCTRGRKSKEDRPCLDCPYNECNLVGGTSERQIKGTCQGWLMKDALSLIKELTQANEMLSG